MKYAIVVKGVVENIVLWDGSGKESPAGKGQSAVLLEDEAVAIGWGYAKDKFSAPPTPPASTTGQAPQVVTMRQAQLALLDAGLYQAVEDAFAVAAAAGSEGIRAQIEWRTAATVERGSPVVADLAKALKLKTAAVDALFLAASKL